MGSICFAEQGIVLPSIVVWMESKKLFSACVSERTRTVRLTQIRLFTALVSAMDGQ